jgi:hypothetical protein
MNRYKLATDAISLPLPIRWWCTNYFISNIVHIFESNYIPDDDAIIMCPIDKDHSSPILPYPSG